MAHRKASSAKGRGGNGYSPELRDRIATWLLCISGSIDSMEGPAEKTFEHNLALGKDRREKITLRVHSLENVNAMYKAVTGKPLSKNIRIPDGMGGVHKTIPGILPSWPDTSAYLLNAFTRARDEYLLHVYGSFDACVAGA